MNLYSQEEIEDFKNLGVFSDPNLIGLRERIYILDFPDFSQISTTS
jgi:hypothetical protein